MMKFETQYEVRQMNMTEELAKKWGISDGLNTAYFLRRVTRVEGSAPELWVDCTPVAVFNTNSEGQVFLKYLEDLRTEKEGC